jgi:hypothetical protein
MPSLAKTLRRSTIINSEVIRETACFSKMGMSSSLLNLAGRALPVDEAMRLAGRLQACFGLWCTRFLPPRQFIDHNGGEIVDICKFISYEDTGDYGAGNSWLVLSVRRYATRPIHSFIAASSRVNALEPKPNPVCKSDLSPDVYCIG